MDPIEAIYVNGVFQPTGPVSLPELTPVTVTPRPVPEQSLGCSSPELYALLSERFDSGDPEGAARHNEHQP